MEELRLRRSPHPCVHPRERPRRADEAGLSLLEVVVCLALLTILALAFVALQVSTSQAVGAVTHEVGAAAVGQRAYEELRGVPFADLLIIDGNQALVRREGTTTSSLPAAYRVHYGASLVAGNLVDLTVRVEPIEDTGERTLVLKGRRVRR